MNNGISLREKIGLITWYYSDKMRGMLRNLKLSDPKAWNPLLWNLYGASQTESGIQVTEETAFNLSSIYAAINIIATTISTLPIHLYKRTPQNARKPITDHPSLMRLKHRANYFVPSINFRDTMMAHILAWGNGYAEIVRNNLGQIIELWPIAPDRVTPQWRNTALEYRVKVENNKEVIIPRENMLHIAGLGYDGLIGYSVVRKAAESIGLSMGAEKFGARYFGSNTNIGGAIKYPRALGEDAQKNLKKSLAEYTGSKNTHRWMILEQGMEIEKLGFSPDDSQFLQTRQFQVSEIARWFNLPPHKLKDLTRSTFSNIEEQEIEFVTSCIRPWLERLEQNYNIQLLTEKENKLGYYFKHSVEGILRGASTARGEFYTKLFYLGALKPNDIRELEDMPPIDDKNADKTYLQMNLTPLEDIGKQPEPMFGNQNPQNGDIIDVEPEEEEKKLIWPHRRMLEYRSIQARDKIAKRYYPLIKDAIGAIIFREETLINRLIKNKKSKRANIENLKNDIEQTYNGVETYVGRKMSPIFHAFGDSIYNQALLEIGESVEEIPDKVKDEFTRYTNIHAKRYVSSSKGQLIKIIDDFDEDFEVAITDRLEEWKENRPDKVAQNESVRMSSFSAQVGFFSYGYKSVWRIRGAQTCPYCQALNGKTIDQKGSFFKGGEDHEPSGAQNGPMVIRNKVMHPPLHQGCDCYISIE